VTDGAFRDTPSIAALDLPTYAAGQSPDVSTAIHHLQDINVPIGCGGGGAAGDVVVGDGEGRGIPIAVAGKRHHRGVRAGTARGIHPLEDRSGQQHPRGVSAGRGHAAR
jgi:regulator of RNase E activity RraA